MVEEKVYQYISTHIISNANINPIEKTGMVIYYPINHILINKNNEEDNIFNGN